MSVETELTVLAGRLTSAGWRGKLPDEITPAEQQEYKRVRDRARQGDEEARRELETWLLWLINEPVDLRYTAGVLRLFYSGQLVAEYRAERELGRGRRG